MLFLRTLCIVWNLVRRRVTRRLTRLQTMYNVLKYSKTWWENDDISIYRYRTGTGNKFNLIMRVTRNENTFVDRDECGLLNGGCQDICTNTGGSFACSCHDNRTLGTNGFSCKGMLIKLTRIYLQELFRISTSGFL